MKHIASRSLHGLRAILATMTTDSATVPPILSIGRGRTRMRVAVITGSYGAGHSSAARELARVFRAVGCAVEVHDIVTLLPWRLGPVLRAVYYAQLRRSPESWNTTLRLLQPGRRLHTVVTWLLAIAVAPVAEATRGCDLVITTHPFAAQALGRGRQTGRIAAPAVTYLTDASVHSLWIHPGIDLNLAIDQIAAHEARQWGGAAVVVRPLVPPGVGEATARGAADPLASHGIVGPRVLVTGGSLGMGDLERTARDIAALGMTPIVLCGTDTRLQRRLSHLPGVVALGWRDDLPALLATSDCVVQNAGGFTCLEALASGTPVITYRPIPGHGAANSLNLERAGLIPWARSRDDLAALLAAALEASHADRLPAGGPDVLAVLTGVVAASAAA
jgi:processive 1,2-diacylglycerol beta-glucosyltransferase